MNQLIRSSRQPHARQAAASFIQNLLTPTLTAIAKPNMPRLAHEPAPRTQGSRPWSPHTTGSYSPVLTRLGHADAEPQEEPLPATTQLNCHKQTQHWAQSPPSSQEDRGHFCLT